MPDGETKKIAIIGAGAAGVFTAYELQKQAPGRFDIRIFERLDRVGGHTRSYSESSGSGSVNIDGGAQFFAHKVQPDYCALLRSEGLLDDRQVIKADASVTIWDATKDELLFKVPPSLLGIAGKFVTKFHDWLCFIHIVREAKKEFELDDWSRSFGSWVERLDLPGAGKKELPFKKEILRPLMYQFGLVRPDRLDELSSKFVLWYFLGSITGLADLDVLNCAKGLDGVLQTLLERAGLGDDHVKCAQGLVTVERRGDGKYAVEAADGSTLETSFDDVVFAVNPPRILDALPANDPGLGELRQLLAAMPYVAVPVHLQKTTTPRFMPGKRSHWSVSNVLKWDDGDGEAVRYGLTVWFGDLRPDDAGKPYFKSWASPAIRRDEIESHRLQIHELMVGTPAFIACRQRLRSPEFQGRNDLWYVGGYIIDYDSQNACLRSAQLVAGALLKKYTLDAAYPALFVSPHEVDAFMASGSADADPDFADLDSALQRIETQVLDAAPEDDPIVQDWKDRFR